jgi:hypothetical protein
MNTPESHVSPIAVAPWANSKDCARAATSKLVVVVSTVSEEAALAGRILEQAKAAGQPALLLGISPTPDGEAELRRSLVMVQAFMSAQGQSVELKSDSGIGWLDRIKAECAPSDQVACYAEMGVGMWNQPLSDILARALQVPIHDFSELRLAPSSRGSILAQAGAWIGSIATIGGFLALQAKIVLEMQGPAQGTALIVTLLPEVALILLWNSMLG